MLTHTRTLWLIYGSHRHTSSCNVHFSRVVLLTFDFHFKNGVWAAAYNCKERPSLIKVIRHWQPGGRGLLGSSFKCFLTFFLRVNLFFNTAKAEKTLRGLSAAHMRRAHAPACTPLLRPRVVEHPRVI